MYSRRAARHRRPGIRNRPECSRAPKEIVLGHPRLSARDALHLAVMEQHEIDRILSFDSGFDGYPGVSRLP